MRVKGFLLFFLIFFSKQIFAMKQQKKTPGTVKQRMIQVKCKKEVFKTSFKTLKKLETIKNQLEMMEGLSGDEQEEIDVTHYMQNFQEIRFQKMIDLIEKKVEHDTLTNEEILGYIEALHFFGGDSAENLKPFSEGLGYSLFENPKLERKFYSDLPVNLTSKFCTDNDSALWLELRQFLYQESPNFKNSPLDKEIINLVIKEEPFLGYAQNRWNSFSVAFELLARKFIEENRNNTDLIAKAPLFISSKRKSVYNYVLDNLIQDVPTLAKIYSPENGKRMLLAYIRKKEKIIESQKKNLEQREKWINKNSAKFSLLRQFCCFPAFPENSYIQDNPTLPIKVNVQSLLKCAEEKEKVIKQQRKKDNRYYNWKSKNYTKLCLGQLICCF